MIFNANNTSHNSPRKAGRDILSKSNQVAVAITIISDMQHTSGSGFFVVKFAAQHAISLRVEHFLAFIYIKSSENKFNSYETRALRCNTLGVVLWNIATAQQF